MGLFWMTCTQATTLSSESTNTGGHTKEIIQRDTNHLIFLELTCVFKETASRDLDYLHDKHAMANSNS